MKEESEMKFKNIFSSEELKEDSVCSILELTAFDVRINIF